MAWSEVFVYIDMEVSDKVDGDRGEGAFDWLCSMMTKALAANQVCLIFF